MSDEKLLRLLTLVCRELAAEDARVEIGGHEPLDDGCHLWVPLGPQRRLVAVFAEAPTAPEGVRARLAALAEAFAETANVAAPAVTTTKRLALNEELGALAERAGACCAVIVDGSSPVIWGRSHAELSVAGDVERWLSAARALDRVEAMLGGASELRELGLAEVKARLRTGQHTEQAAELASVAAAWELPRGAFARWARCGRALVAMREQLVGLPASQLGGLRLVRRDDDGGFYVRGLASVYQLILAFDGPLSEPRVEGVVRRTCPLLEKLIAALPPLEPPPMRGLRLLRPE